MMTIRYMVAWLGFFVFTLFLVDASFALLIPIIDPVSDSDLSIDDSGIQPFTALFIVIIPTLLLSFLAKKVIGWPQTRRKWLAFWGMAASLLVVFAIMLPPDDWGRYQLGRWVPASPARQTAYDLWSALGMTVGFILPYLRFFEERLIRKS